MNNAIALLIFLPVSVNENISTIEIQDIERRDIFIHLNVTLLLKLVIINESTYK